MKKYLTIFLFILLTASLTAESISKKVKSQAAIQNPAPSFSIEEDTDLFFEDWESGIGDWVHVDETATPPQWHLDTWNAYSGSGESWWMADPSLGSSGGYADNWYQVLDTEGIALSGSNLQLSFYHSYSVEGPAGASSPYTGWDGFNLRISTDGGSTWAVLTDPVPAYNVTSLYSFGQIHGEGPNVPGWAGASTGWEQVTVDLSAFDGQTVNIRFAFASDGAWSTGDDGSLTGWQVDEIMVTNSSGTLFSNDGSVTGLTASNNTAAGADLWHVESGPAVSGTHYADCNNDANTYVANMNNSLTSPWISLPSVVSTVYFDFSLRGTYTDNDDFPNVDYFGAFIQVEGETTLRYISNITQDPSGSNFVYSSSPADWATFSESYSTGLVDLSSLIGNNIRIIFTFESDGDAPLGEAVQIDDVKIWTPDVVPVELTSFTAVQQGAFVNLEWNTATELNNHGFEIERKVEAEGQNSDWRMVAFKKGNGTMSEPVAYSYRDNIEGISAEKIHYRLKQIDFNGQYEYSDEVLVSNIAPLEYSISQNYPNPFNPTTEISFAVPAQNYVSLKVYNVTGEEVAVLADGIMDAGRYNLTFNASALPSGVYFYSFKAGASESSSAILKTQKMMLLK